MKTLACKVKKITVYIITVLVHVESSHLNFTVLTLCMLHQLHTISDFYYRVIIVEIQHLFCNIDLLLLHLDIVTKAQQVM